MRILVVEDESLAEDPKNELVKVVGMNAAILSEKGEHNGKNKDKDKVKTYDNGVYCVFYNISDSSVKRSKTTCACT